MKIPEGLTKSVIFLCYYDQDRKLRFAGTAFIQTTDIHIPTGLAHSLIITARHVIASIQKNSVDQKVWLRVNSRNQQDVELLETDVSDWIFHPDTVWPADVAVLHYAPPIEKYDVTSAPPGVLNTNEFLAQKIIDIGTEVFMVGLFAHHTGNKRNQPILRAGVIAMIPDEHVHSNLFGNMEGYLIESRSIGGLSGSPVYAYRFDIESRTENGSQYIGLRSSIFLLGLIHGHYDVAVPKEDMIVDDIGRKESVNTGIAIVVPVSKILETINQPAIATRRRSYED